MKQLITAAFFFIICSTYYAGGFIAELENSIARAGKGSKVEYILHLTNGKEHTITGHDFTSGKLAREGNAPLYFELFKGSGDKKQNFMINLQNATYYELFIEKNMGIWNYTFHFYY
jgi:hypothetical protein